MTQAGNVTSLPDLFPVVASSLGISPLVLGFGFLAMTAIPSVFLRLPKSFTIVTLLMGSFTMAYIGVLPFWMLLFSCAFTGLFFAKEAASMFRGSSLGTPDFEKPMSAWVTNLYEREQAEAPVRSSWNCKNCGGPNINQIKCEYCGAVKE